MKKVFLGLTVVLTLATTSCGRESMVERNKIPTKAIILLKQNKFDTILVVRTVDKESNKSINMFDTKQNFKGTVNETEDLGVFVLVGIFGGILIGLLIGGAILR